jgi:hypothetical protein
MPQNYGENTHNHSVFMSVIRMCKSRGFLGGNKQSRPSQSDKNGRQWRVVSTLYGVAHPNTCIVWAQWVSRTPTFTQTLSKYDILLYIYWLAGYFMRVIRAQFDMYSYTVLCCSIYVPLPRNFDDQINADISRRLMQTCCPVRFSYYWLKLATSTDATDHVVFFPRG